MPRESKIQYNPRLSVAENAKKCGVTEDAIRYYIRTRGIDRRFEEKKKVLKGMKAYLKEHPNATRAELAKETGHGINTVRRYWDILHGEGKLKPSEKKADVREQRVTTINNRHIAYLDKLPVEFIREYLAARETTTNAVAEVIPEAVEVVEQTSIEVVEVIEQTAKKTKTAKKQKAKAVKEPKAKKASDTIKCSDKYAYFYQDTPLSNWWASNPRIPYDGHEFGSSEALFMYLKAKGMGDVDVALQIVEADNDSTLTDKERFAKAKKLGRMCKFDEAIFFEKREEWMYTAISAKYEVDEEFRSVLMSDKYRGLTFVEASPWDANWGIKSRATKEVLEKGESAWKGLNLLGKLLTQLRDEHLDTYTAQHNHSESMAIKSICGGVLGDISGCTREKSSKSVYTTDFDLFPPKSHPTDDSVLTVAIADWLLHKDTISLSEALRGWGKKYPKAGFGSGFREYIKSGIEYCSDKNGAAMRVSPIAVVASSLEEALSLAKESALPTHNSEEGIKGAQSIAAAIYLVREGVANGKDASTIKSEVKSYIETTFGYDLDQSIESIRLRSQRFAEMKRVYRATGVENPEFRQMSDAAISVPMAFIAFLEGNSYEEVLRIAISLGGDADTIGCMASSISVHLYGIPQEIYNEGCGFIPSDMMAIIEEFDAKYLAK